MSNENKNRRWKGWTLAGVLAGLGFGTAGAAAFNAAADRTDDGNAAAVPTCCAAKAMTATAAVAPAPLAAEPANAAEADAARLQVDVVVKSYLSVQRLLADDKMDGVEAGLTKLKEAAAGLAERPGDEKVKTVAAEVTNAAEAAPKTLKEARSAFKPLSAAVIRLTELVPPSAAAAPALYQANCPMAKADWLQATKELVNPYMGKDMLDCGRVKRKIETAPGKGGK